MEFVHSIGPVSTLVEKRARSHPGPVYRRPGRRVPRSAPPSVAPAPCAEPAPVDVPPVELSPDIWCLHDWEF
jgi:hypothetical protein